MQSLQKDDGTVLIEQNAILKETEQLEDINLNEYVGQTMKLSPMTKLID